MGIHFEPTVSPKLGELGEVEIARMWATAGIDEPVGMPCPGNDFGFNFFSAELDIQNIPRNNSSGHAVFPLEIVRSADVFAQTSTRDSGTIGSTTIVEQDLTVSLAAAN